MWGSSASPMLGKNADKLSSTVCSMWHLQPKSLPTVSGSGQQQKTVKKQPSAPTSPAPALAASTSAASSAATTSRSPLPSRQQTDAMLRELCVLATRAEDMNVANFMLLDHMNTACRDRLVEDVEYLCSAALREYLHGLEKAVRDLRIRLAVMLANLRALGQCLLFVGRRLSGLPMTHLGGLRMRTGEADQLLVHALETDPDAADMVQ